MELHPLVIAQVVGFTQLNPDQIKADKNLNKIDDMLRQSNKNDLRGAVLSVAFMRNAGLTRSYKIYYLTDVGSIIEAYVNTDLFRNKNYVLSVYTLVRKTF